MMGRSKVSQHSATWKKIKFLVEFFRISEISILSFTAKVAFSVYIFYTFHIQYIK